MLAPIRPAAASSLSADLTTCATSRPPAATSVFVGAHTPRKAVRRSTAAPPSERRRDYVCLRGELRPIQRRLVPHQLSHDDRHPVGHTHCRVVRNAHVWSLLRGQPPRVHDAARGLLHKSGPLSLLLRCVGEAASHAKVSEAPHIAGPRAPPAASRRLGLVLLPRTLQLCELGGCARLATNVWMHRESRTEILGADLLTARVVGEPEDLPDRLRHRGHRTMPAPDVDNATSWSRQVHGSSDAADRQTTGWHPSVTAVSKGRVLLAVAGASEGQRSDAQALRSIVTGSTSLYMTARTSYVKWNLQTLFSR